MQRPQIIRWTLALLLAFPFVYRGIGWLWPNSKPGLGVDIDEKKAAKYPIRTPPIEWTQSRWPDGTLWTP